MTKENDFSFSDYNVEDWLETLGSKPVKQIAHEDASEPYEMQMIHVVELENGKYATISEIGCSCYESSQAEIELFPTKEAAMFAYLKWIKEYGRSHDSK